MQEHKLYFYELYIFYSGRIGKAIYLKSLLLLILTYLNILLVLNIFTSAILSHIFVNLCFIWMLGAISSKRLHDINKSAFWMLVGLIPVGGPLYLMYLLFKSANAFENAYGLRFEDVKYDYYENPVLKNERLVIINDVTQNNPIAVNQVVRPTDKQEIIELLQTTSAPVSIGGGRFSMGGQTASSDSIHIDMRQMNKIVAFKPLEKLITVQTGVRWCDIQRVIDKFDLSIMIMQTYANFTVGGSLSVNVHGRYMGQGPLILSVVDITLVLANGELIKASREQNSEYFYASIGGYGGIGVIVEATLKLADNCNLERTTTKMKIQDYLEYFRTSIRENSEIIMHNGDIYPPNYKRVNAVSWRYTNKPITTNTRLQKIKKIRLLYRYFLWSIAETPLGKYRREYIVEKLTYLPKKIHSRNYEAGYDVHELAPIVTKRKFWQLQEYFIPVEHFDSFVVIMSESLQRYDINALNISIRHAYADSDSLLSWAKGEVFAFVLYFKQEYSEIEQTKIGIFTRELIDEVIKHDGSYYLPYQIFATNEQFHQVYPRAREFFEFKTQVDKTYRFRNKLWDTYYKLSSIGEC